MTSRNRVKEVERTDPNRAIVKPGQSPGIEVAETDPNRVTEHEKIVRNRERKVVVTNQNQKKNHVSLKVAVNDQNRVTEIAPQKRKPQKQNLMKKVVALVLTNAYPTGARSLKTSLKVNLRHKIN